MIALSANRRTDHGRIEPVRRVLPGIYAPFRAAGQKIADFLSPSSVALATQDAYEITIELPGVAAEDIDVSVHEGTLVVKGQKRSSHEEEGRNYFFSERSYGAFLRSFRLPGDSDAERIAADHQDGVLTILVPRRAAAPTGGRKVEVRSQ